MMNSPLRKLYAISLALLLLLPGLLTATQQPIPVKIYSEYGMITAEQRPSILMSQIFTPVPRHATVRSLRQSPLLFRVAGGIMLDAVGQPCNQLATKRLSLSYDRQRPPGDRLALHVDDEVYLVSSLEDGDLRAIAEFSASANPILVNATIPRIKGKESCPSPPGLRMVKLHEAFRNTRLGWLLTRMDTIPWSLSRSERWATDEPLPDTALSLGLQLGRDLRADYDDTNRQRYPELRRLIASGRAALARLKRSDRLDLRNRVNEISQADWERYEEAILEDAEIDREAWSKLSVDERRTLLMHGYSFQRISNINDHQSPPSFCVTQSSLEFSGTPRLEFFQDWFGAPRQLKLSTGLMSRNFTQLALIDEDAYDATMEIYNLSALFKYVRQRQSRALWRRFVNSLPPRGDSDDIEIACPACTRDEVVKWLACLSSPS